jgi:hypothetical protein
MDCHDHDYDEDYATPDGFMPSACEGCHGNPPHVGLDMLPGTCDDAPNVMGDGVSIGGTGTTPKRFDDGTFGYNVNGHGANGTADNTPTAGMTFPDLECTECHNISEPSSPTTHLDGTLDTKVFPGSSPCYGPATANTSHLIPAIFFGSITNESSYQTNFDAACYSNAACHGTSPTIGHRHRMPPNVMVRFGSSGSTLDPKAARPLPYWTPWTISDITDAAELPPSSYHSDGVNHMVVEDFCDKPYFCNSNCHLP